MAAAAASIGFACLKLSNPVSVAIARLELATLGGARLVLDVDLDRAAEQQKVLEQVRKTIAKRLETATGHTVLVHGEGSRLFADLPRRAWAQLLRVNPGVDGLQKLFISAKLEFTIVDDEDASLKRLSELPPGITLEREDRLLGPKDAFLTVPYLASKDWQALLAFAKDRAPAGRVLAVSLKPDGTGEYRTYLLHERAALTGKDVSDARVSINRGEKWPSVVVAFTEPGARSLDSLTTSNRWRRLAIVFDGRVHSAPVITTPITGGYCEINLGGYKRPVVDALQEAKDLSLILKSGALAAPVHLVSVDPVGGGSLTWAP